ncbi:MAG: DUF1614 domain-containing protein [Desulfovibrionaceae bacterium]|nr:DUF1614 domain-containing protein [Desulfovibrionaceae bacterium]
MRGPLFNLPTVLFFGVLLFLVLIFFFILIQIGIITVAFSKLGLTPGQGFLLLLATLFGSTLNIPVHRSRRLVRDVKVRTVRLFGPFGPGSFPDPDQARTLKEQVLAVNVGGCLIPCGLSLYFLVQMAGRGGFFLWAVLAVVLVSAVCFALARPVPGVGIGIPVLIPPLVTALTALVLVPGEVAPHVAYISGSLGTLIGADILHLFNPRTRQALDAPVISIGGAGTFDGIFLTGILAVFLA